MRGAEGVRVFVPPLSGSGSNRLAAAVAALALLGGSARAAQSREADKAVEAAAAKAVADLSPQKLGEVKSVTVLPLWKDDGYATDMVKAALAGKGVQILLRSDEEWKPLLDEIAWGTRREDVMDSATIQRFEQI